MRPIEPKVINRFKRRLLSWYREQARDLPWRRTRDAYHVMVSEFMLQQTQVSRVREFYGKFLARYPTLESLARARPAAVRESWEGLGYYRRASNLHQLARTVMAEHRGRIPDDPVTLMTLPGVGPYTAGAVASFAYERREAAVDTNVARVVIRTFMGKREEGRGKGTAKKAGKREEGRGKSTAKAAVVWSLTRRLLPRKGKTAWEFNQALMDLGATICTARRPRCEVCPVRPACRTGAR